MAEKQKKISISFLAHLHPRVTLPHGVLPQLCRAFPRNFSAGQLSEKLRKTSLADVVNVIAKTLGAVRLQIGWQSDGGRFSVKLFSDVLLINK